MIVKSSVLVIVAFVFCCVLKECESDKTVSIPVEQKPSPKVTKCSGSAAKGPRCRLLLLEQIYYVGLIEVGDPGQKIVVMFDTGSSSLWVASTVICTNNTNYCKSHKTYDHTQSKAYKKNDKKWSIEYFDGQVTGFLSQDDVAVGGLKVKGQLFAEATVIGTQEDVSAGVLGLGFTRSSSPDLFFVNLVKQKVVDHEVFAFFFDRNNRRSELLLGAADPKHFVPPMIFSPVVGNDHWRIKVDKILVNNTVIVSNYEAILDSGSTHIAGPIKIIDAIHKTIGKRDNLGMVYVNCNQVKTFPTITFVINKVGFPLKPQDYMLFKKGKCESGFTAVEGIPEVILGNVWMTKFYTVFDLGQKRLGFALAKP